MDLTVKSFYYEQKPLFLCSKSISTSETEHELIFVWKGANMNDLAATFVKQA